MKRDYIALWGLLAVAFIIIFLLSFKTDGFTIGGVGIKTSGMAQAVFGARGDTLALDTIPAIEVEPAKAEIDTVPKTILFIGDSMLEGLSPRLAAYCDASGHKLYTAIWYSSTSDTWGSVNLITDYINRVHPDYIFICLGANELFVSDIAAKRDAKVKHMLAEIGDIPYVWIGPPNWKPDTGINDLIAANVPKGRFFLTNGMTFDRKKDGAHPTAASAIVWMDSIARWMPEHCSHPILLNEPEQKTSRPVRIFTHAPGPDPYKKAK